MPNEPIQIRNFINGQFVEPAGGKYLDNIEPATGKPYSQVPDSDAARCRIWLSAAAEKAFPDWSRKPAARAIEDSSAHRRPDRARSRETRARRVDRYGQAALARALARYSARCQQFPFLRDGDPAHGIGSAHHRRRRVQLHAASATRHRGIDFAVESAALLVELENRARHRSRQHRHRQAERADADDGVSALRELPPKLVLPNGVLNVVHGTGPNVGAAITAHPKIGTISFTGGTVTGRKVAETCAPMFKKVSLELGGKNPNIIFADADLDAAIAGSVRSSFANQGQVCLCGSRVFVERSAYKDFVDRFVEKAVAVETRRSAG